MKRGGAWVQVALALALAGALGCATSPSGAPVLHSPDLDPGYEPARGILEIVAILQHHVPDDTYRFEPARDVTGRNVYRASLTRLENLERIHGESLRAGHMNDVLAFAKARALERLRAFELAGETYSLAARSDGPLQHEARKSEALCEALAEGASIGFELKRPEPEGGTGEAPDQPDLALADYDRRYALLEALLEEAQGSHYEAVVREEMERADTARAGYFLARRRLQPDGDVRAVAELQRVASVHRESKNANRHMIALADLYADLAEEYVESRPPESLWFDPPVFQDLVEGAAKLYQVVANQDGAPEKLEASRRLEAFLAFTLRVDQDRFND